MNSPLIVALPSKGRLKEQTEAWLADCGFEVGGASTRLKAMKIWEAAPTPEWAARRDAFVASLKK